MAIERLLASAGPSLFTLNGGADGLVTISDTQYYKVKAKVVISATSLPDITLEVKRVLSKTQLIVGLPGNIRFRSDISLYTVALGASIFQAQQERPNPSTDDRERSTFEEEPTLARRVILVDWLGNYYADGNALPVKLQDANITVNGSGSKNPIVRNVSLTTSGTEYSFTFPITTTRYLFKIRGHNGSATYGFTSNPVEYMTLDRGTNVYEEGLKLDGTLTLYIKPSKDSLILEVQYWE